jgi:hypothetical protein
MRALHSETGSTSLDVLRRRLFRWILITGKRTGFSVDLHIVRSHYADCYWCEWSPSNPTVRHQMVLLLFIATVIRKSISLFMRVRTSASNVFWCVKLKLRSGLLIGSETRTCSSSAEMVVTMATTSVPCSVLYGNTRHARMSSCFLHRHPLVWPISWDSVVK